MLRFESEKEHVLVFTFILARQEKVTLLRVNDSSFDGLLIFDFSIKLKASALLVVVPDIGIAFRGSVAFRAIRAPL